MLATVPSRSSRWPLFLLLAGCVVTASSSARADEPTLTPTACIAASLKGQQLRAAGHWIEARESLSACVDRACPPLIRHDCSTWVEELTASAPTVVLGAQDASGHDLAAIRVTIDGVDVTAQASGQATPVDPGSHVVRYVRPDGTRVEESFVARAGEKDRTLVLKFPAGSGGGMPSGITALAPSETSAPSDTASKPGASNATVGITVGAAGLALLGVGAYFIAAESSKTSDLETLCAHGACSAGTANNQSLPSQVSTVNTERALAGVSFGLAAAALGVATYLLVARPLGRRTTTAPAASLEGLRGLVTRGAAGPAYAISF
jgi:hypothetical protein